MTIYISVTKYLYKYRTTHAVINKAISSFCYAKQKYEI
jgi:hypothetical protein